MSLEAAAIIFALLWGPTLLWLIFRVVRGPNGGTRESFGGEPAAQRTEQLPLEAGIRRDYWICKDCRSVNHLGAMHCYSCLIEREPVEPVAADPVRAGNGWVPVMDQSLGRPSGEPAPVTRLEPTSSVRPPDPPVVAPLPEPAPEPVPEPAMVAAGALADSQPTKRPRTPRRPRSPAAPAAATELSSALPPEPPVVSPSPEPAPETAMVPAGGVAASRATKRPRAPRRPRSPAEPATATELSVAAHMTAAPPTAIASAAIEPAAIEPAASEPATNLPQVTPTIAPPVCPYLGFKDDRATQCSYPDDRNVCHAASAGGGSSLANPRRLLRGVRGGGRTLPISADHQARLCLTAEHRRCDRYPAAPATPEPSQAH